MNETSDLGEATRISAEIRWEPEDVIRAQRLFIGPRKWFRRVGYVMAVVWTLGLGWLLKLVIASGTGWVWWSALFGGGLWLAHGYFVRAPRNIRKAFREQKFIGKPATISADVTGFEACTEFGDLKFPWEYFSRWRRDGHTILLYDEGGSLRAVLPKRFFSGDQIRVLESLLAERVGPETAPTNWSNLATWAAAVALLLPTAFTLGLVPESMRSAAPNTVLFSYRFGLPISGLSMALIFATLVAAPVLLLWWAPDLRRGAAEMPTKTLVLLALVAVSSALYFLWQRESAAQGIGLKAWWIDLALSAGLGLSTALLAGSCRRRPAFWKNLLAHSLLFAWLITYAFPWIG